MATTRGERMNDRFKFRLWHKPLKTMHYNDFIVTATGYIAKIYQQDDYMMKFNQEDLEFDKQCVLMQCTGLKDKNGTLIYEGDIVKYAEFDWTDFSFKDWETEIAQVVWGNTYDNYYPAFDLKDTDFDGTNAFAYLFNEGWTVEVIGNIYENKSLLESEG